MTLPAALEPIARAPQQSAFATDFDGTLAPIVDDPASSTAVAGALDALAALVAQVRLVAVISGRPVDFLAARVPIDGVVLIGQYGLERLDRSGHHVDERTTQYLESVERATREAQERFPGLLVEPKGGLAATVHWRTAPELEPEPGVLTELAFRHGLVAHAGRMAVELRTPVPVDKGTAFAALLRDAGSVTNAAFAGDDRGDLGAFDALDAFEAEGGRVARVAVRSSEAPPPLLTRADVTVDGPAALAVLLGELADAVSRPG